MTEDHSSLELPDKSASDEELEALSTLRHVRLRLSEKGIEEPMQPQSKIPEIPANISELSDTDVGELYSAMVAWDGYYTMETAWADAEVKEAKNKLEFIIMKLSGGMKKTNKHNADPRVTQARAELQATQQLATILEANHKVISSKLRMISRNIELRKLDWEKQQRETNIGRTRIPHHKMGK